MKISQGTKISKTKIDRTKIKPVLNLMSLKYTNKMKDMAVFKTRSGSVRMPKQFVNIGVKENRGILEVLYETMHLI